MNSKIIKNALQIVIIFLLVSSLFIMNGCEKEKIPDVKDFQEFPSEVTVDETYFNKIDPQRDTFLLDSLITQIDTEFWDEAVGNEGENAKELNDDNFNKIDKNADYESKKKAVRDFLIMEKFDGLPMGSKNEISEEFKKQKYVLAKYKYYKALESRIALGEKGKAEKIKNSYSANLTNLRKNCPERVTRVKVNGFLQNNATLSTWFGSGNYKDIIDKGDKWKTDLLKTKRDWEKKRRDADKALKSLDKDINAADASDSQKAQFRKEKSNVEKDYFKKGDYERSKEEANEIAGRVPPPRKDPNIAPAQNIIAVYNSNLSKLRSVCPEKQESDLTKFNNNKRQMKIWFDNDKYKKVVDEGRKWNDEIVKTLQTWKNERSGALDALNNLNDNDKDKIKKDYFNKGKYKEAKEKADELAAKAKKAEEIKPEEKIAIVANELIVEKAGKTGPLGETINERFELRLKLSEEDDPKNFEVYVRRLKETPDRSQLVRDNKYRIDWPDMIGKKRIKYTELPEGEGKFYFYIYKNGRLIPPDPDKSSLMYKEGAAN